MKLVHVMYQWLFPLKIICHMILQGTAISSPSEEYDASRDLPPSYTELFGEIDDGDCKHSVQNIKTQIKITQE